MQRNVCTVLSMKLGLYDNMYIFCPSFNEKSLVCKKKTIHIMSDPNTSKILTMNMNNSNKVLLYIVTYQH